jgi:hypothetical protein
MNLPAFSHFELDSMSHSRKTLQARRCLETWQEKIYCNSHRNLCTECPNNTNNKLATNGTFTELLPTCHACCQVATLQDYTFHRCIHADFTKVIHTHVVQPCFQEREAYKYTTTMLINPFMIRMAILVNEDSMSN